MENAVEEKKVSKMMEEPTYDAATRTLTLRFKSAKGEAFAHSYAYVNFPEDKFKEFYEAPSWGKFFGANRALFANGVKQVPEDKAEKAIS